jgi:hypothetical protein
MGAFSGHPSPRRDRLTALLPVARNVRQEDSAARLVATTRRLCDDDQRPAASQSTNPEPLVNTRGSPPPGLFANPNGWMGAHTRECVIPTRDDNASHEVSCPSGDIINRRGLPRGSAATHSLSQALGGLHVCRLARLIADERHPWGSKREGITSEDPRPCTPKGGGERHNRHYRSACGPLASREIPHLKDDTLPNTRASTQVTHQEICKQTPGSWTPQTAQMGRR